MRRQQLGEVRDVDKDHGRIEIPLLSCSWRFVGYLEWPGFAQAIQIERTRIVGSKRTTEVSHAITSLDPSRADAGELLQLSRGHWRIENRLHWVRDVTMGEDKCRARTGQGPENLATLRNTALTLQRTNRYKAIAPAPRRMATKPKELIKILRRFEK